MNSKAPCAEDLSRSSNVAALLEQVTTEGKSLLEGKGSSREGLLGSARSLCIALETPMEAILRYGWAMVSFISCTSLSNDYAHPITLDSQPSKLRFVLLSA